MSANYKKLGDIVELIDERNKYGKVQNLIGVSIDKCFIKSVANTIGTDLTKYQVIRKNDFACSLMQVSRDGKIPIACLKDYDEAIMSPAYYIFRIKNTNEVLPDYLAMWFMRTEFDREASYIAVGGVRGSMPWEDFCDMKLPVPDLKEQEKIVKTYNTITKRIQLKQKINENLEKTVQCLFDNLFMKDNDDLIELNEIIEVNPERILKKGEIYKCFDMSSLPTKNAIPFEYELKEYNGGMKFKNGDTLMARITPCLENGKAAYINLLDEKEIAFGSTEFIVLSAKRDFPSSFNYFLVRNPDFITYAIKHMNGSSGRQRVSGEDIGRFMIQRPKNEDLENFNLLGSEVLKEMKESSLEIAKLQELKQLVISRISGM